MTTYVPYNNYSGSGYGGGSSAAVAAAVAAAAGFGLAALLLVGLTAEDTNKASYENCIKKYSEKEEPRTNVLDKIRPGIYKFKSKNKKCSAQFTASLEEKPQSKKKNATNKNPQLKEYSLKDLENPKVEIGRMFIHKNGKAAMTISNDKTLFMGHIDSQSKYKRMRFYYPSQPSHYIEGMPYGANHTR